MDGGDRRRRPPWNKFKGWLRWKGMSGFCGTSNWVFTDDINAGVEPLMPAFDQSPAAVDNFHPPPESCIPVGGGITMNLATALAAERQQMAGPTGEMKIKPLKSLMSLFEEIDGRDDDGGGIGTVCCLCMERKKRAALIPCGHTYCRVCSREAWLKRKPCPLCNRSIKEILDIY